MVKKIIILFTIVCILLSSVFVNASNIVFDGKERIEGVYYVKASKSETQYRIGVVIRNTLNDKVAYCIEPFKALGTSGNYTSYTDFDESLNISPDTWKRISLLSYYGFGYEGHEDEKWFSITQVMIWRSIDKESSFNWINNLSEKEVIYPFEEEINELETLVSNHSVLPTVPKEIHMTTGDTIVIEDKNNVLNSYVLEGDNNDYIDGNFLYVSDNGERDREIKLVKKGNLNEPAIFYYNNESQNTIERGNFEDEVITIKIKVITGSISIEKNDYDTKSTIPSGEGVLSGSEFLLVGENQEYSLKIGDDLKGLVSDLPLGRYLVKEIKSGDGYNINKEDIEVIITEENKDINLVIDNKIKESKLKIIKYYGSYEEFKNNEMRKEKDVLFEIYDRDDKLVNSIITNEEGYGEATLPYGKYVVRQKSSMDGYDFVSDKEVIVDGSEEEILYTLNDYEIEVPNASIDFRESVRLVCLKVLEESF